MKQLLPIWSFLLLAVLTACNSRESQEMEAALEQAKAVYGDGNLEIEVDTVLFIPGLSEAPAYFAGKRQYGKAALAALLNGYTEKDFDKEAAMLSFKEAEHYGELAQDSLTMARAEYWMGKMLYEEGKIKETLPLLKASFDLIGNRKIDRSIVENGMAAAYILLHQLDSAEMFLQNSLHDAQTSGSKITEQKALQNLALLYWIQGDNDGALACLRRVLEHETVDKETSVKVFLTFGNTFMTMNEPDSAAWYYRRMEEIMSDGRLKSVTKVSAYDALLNFAKKKGNDSLALQYYEKHESALFEVMNQRQKQTVYRIQKQYDYETLQNTMNKKVIQRHRVILVFGLLLLVLFVIILVLQHRHNQMLKSEEELRRQLNAIKEDLNQAVDISVIDKVVVSQLRNIIVANHMMRRTQNTKNEWLPLLFEVMGGKDNVFEAAKTIIEVAYPTLFSVILEKHPNLSDTEAKVCLMSCFELTNAEIAELLDLSTNTINQNRSTLRKKLNLGSEKMSKQLRELIAK